jgi:predicted nucleic acid-binding protein
MTVVDSSALVAILTDYSRSGEHARHRISLERELHAPYLIDLEVVSTLRKMTHRSEISEHDALSAMSSLARFPLLRYPPWWFTRRIWEFRHNLTPYDAVYVALAEALEHPLLTTDRRLADATGPRCTFELIPE